MERDAFKIMHEYRISMIQYLCAGGVNTTRDCDGRIRKYEEGNGLHKHVVAAEELPTPLWSPNKIPGGHMVWSENLVRSRINA